MRGILVSGRWFSILREDDSDYLSSRWLAQDCADLESTNKSNEPKPDLGKYIDFQMESLNSKLRQLLGLYRLVHIYTHLLNMMTFRTARARTAKTTGAEGATGTEATAATTRTALEARDHLVDYSESNGRTGYVLRCVCRIQG